MMKEFMKYQPKTKGNNVTNVASRLAKKLLPPLVTASIMLATMTDAYANPTGGQVTTGSGTIAQSGSNMTITQTTDKVGINWQSFNINSGEKVQFIQPNNSSIALNRVIGSDPSRIYGALNANGKVFLVNPSGVLFAPGSQVNVGGLVASTLNISDNDFVKGKYKFSGSGGTVVSQGNITADDGGYVALLGSQVRNEGIVVAQKGTVALGAGSTVTLDLHGDGFLNLAVDESVMNASAANHNLIQADGGQVIMTARAAGTLAGTVVNNTGVIQARGISNVNGIIRFDGGANGTVINSGTLDASGKQAGQTGGTIKVLGDKVELSGLAKLDASGANGGGKILIGGNAQGQGAEQNATNTYVGRDASIKADAITQGNGGQVVVWANDTTNFNGIITARGGVNAGDGGNVEVSGKQYLAYNGFTDLHAYKGKTGNLLLDPADYTIATSGGDITGTALGIQLGSANVTILSSDGTHGGNSGDINVNDAVSWNSGNTLTLSAYRDVNVNAHITANGNAAGLIITPSTGGSGNYNLASGAKITLSGTNPRFSIAGQSYTVINSLTALQNMSANLSGCYVLGTEIDASATLGWNGGAGFVPIGTWSGSPVNTASFLGVFDGGGHAITGLMINRPSDYYVGLFGATQGANIRNVGITASTVSGLGDVGGLVGLAKNSNVSNSYFNGTVNGTSNFVGGLAGYIDASSISNSYALGTINATIQAGGLIGSAQGEAQRGIYNTITNCYSNSTVNGSQELGGLIATLSGGSIVNNSYSMGTVNGTGNNIGGLIGSVGLGTINNSYNLATVSGSMSVGGLVGESGNVTINNSYNAGNVRGTSGVGGLLGASIYDDSSSHFIAINNSYNTGNVSGHDFVGGIIGAAYTEVNTLTNTYNAGAITGSTNTSIGSLVGGATHTILINNSFWDSQTSGRSTGIGSGGSGGTGLSTAQMMDHNNFTGWDFANTWRIYDGYTDPLLKAFMTPLTVKVNNAVKTYDGMNYDGSAGLAYSTETRPSAVLGIESYGNAKNAGAYSIIPTGLYSGQQGYDITYIGGNLTVNPATLTAVTATSQSRAYGDANPPLTGTATGWKTVNGDGNQLLTGFTTTAMPGSSVGRYVIDASNVSAGGNYIISGTPANATLIVNSVTVQTPPPIASTNIMTSVSQGVAATVSSAQRDSGIQGVRGVQGSAGSFNLSNTGAMRGHDGLLTITGSQVNSDNPATVTTDTTTNTDALELSEKKRKQSNL